MIGKLRRTHLGCYSTRRHLHGRLTARMAGPGPATRFLPPRTTWTTVDGRNTAGYDNRLARTVEESATRAAGI